MDESKCKFWTLCDRNNDVNYDEDGRAYVYTTSQFAAKAVEYHFGSDEDVHIDAVTIEDWADYDRIQAALRAQSEETHAETTA